MAFEPLLVDARHNSCTLVGHWMNKAKADIRYKRTLERLQKRQLKWKYDETDCECISVFGDECHDPRNQCKVCGQCIADQPMLGNSWDCSDDPPYCVPCVMALEQATIEEIAPLFG